MAGRRRPWFVALVLLGWLVALPAPADAHPFGAPSTARITVDSGNVELQWLAAEDDWLVLGQHVGAFETKPSEVDLTGAQKLERSEPLKTYFLDHFAVMQDGRPCAGRVESLSDPLGEGLRMVFDCSQPIDQIELTVSPLTDINENYRTVVSSDSPSQPAQALYAIAAPTQLWHFDAAGGSTSLVMPIAVAGVIGVGGALAIGFWWRRSSTAAQVERQDSLV